MKSPTWYDKDRDGEQFMNNQIAQETKAFIQKIINLYCPDLFTCPEDITPDNFKDFLEVILKQYQNYNIKYNSIRDIGDIIEMYFFRAFAEDFPDASYPTFSKGDRRELVLTISNNTIETYAWGTILPEDVPFILECLNAPEDQIELMYEKLDKYFDQFDDSKRFDEVDRRWKIITEQRIEALQKGEPLPIRPMGIKLDMCYKTQEQKKEG